MGLATAHTERSADNFDLFAQGRFTDAYMGESHSKRVPRHPRPGLRSPLRAGMPSGAWKKNRSPSVAEARRG